MPGIRLIERFDANGTYNRSRAAGSLVEQAQKQQVRSRNCNAQIQKYLGEIKHLVHIDLLSSKNPHTSFNESREQKVQSNAPPELLSIKAVRHQRRKEFRLALAHSAIYSKREMTQPLARGQRAIRKQSSLRRRSKHP